MSGRTITQDSNGTVYGSGSTCFHPRHPEREDTLLCDRTDGHPGRHAATDPATGRRVYWRSW